MPEEGGLMLRALGFGNHVQMYVASSEVRGDEQTLASLKALFPIFIEKRLISKEELKSFSIIFVLDGCTKLHCL